MVTTVRKNRTHRRRGNVKSRKMTNNRSHLRQQRGGFVLSAAFIISLWKIGAITYGSLTALKKLKKATRKIEEEVEKEYGENSKDVIDLCKSIVKKTSII